MSLLDSGIPEDSGVLWHWCDLVFCKVNWERFGGFVLKFWLCGKPKKGGKIHTSCSFVHITTPPPWPKWIGTRAHWTRIQGLYFWQKIRSNWHQSMASYSYGRGQKSSWVLLVKIWKYDCVRVQDLQVLLQQMPHFFKEVVIAIFRGWKSSYSLSLIPICYHINLIWENSAEHFDLQRPL